MPRSRSAILLISCPDRMGIVAAVTGFLHENNGNIVDLEQHVDVGQGVFFMRAEWDLSEFAIPPERLETEFRERIGDPFSMQWQLHYSDQVPRLALFVSRRPHCLHDILARVQSGEWRVEIPLIVSNHPDLEPVARAANIPFHVLPIDPANRQQQEQRQLALLRDHDIELIVLARYMQIVSPEFIEQYPSRIINIHHSFLPAFPGARPYHSAHERGVKIIGATSHYVTPELDAGPIIEQDTVRVSHSDGVSDLVRKGRDLEKVVLSRAIWKHLQRKVLPWRNRTIVFV